MYGVCELFMYDYVNIESVVLNMICFVCFFIHVCMMLCLSFVCCVGCDTFI